MDWSRDLPADAQLALVVHLERALGRVDEAVVLREAIHEFFGAAGCQHATKVARSLPARANQSRHRCDMSRVVDRLWRCTRRLRSRQPLDRDRAGEPAHRRLGGDVAAPGSISLRLVADSRGGSLVRPIERDAGQNRDTADVSSGEWREDRPAYPPATDHRGVHRVKGVHGSLAQPRSRRRT